MWPDGLSRAETERVIHAALAEDVGSGCITSTAVLPEGTRFHGVLAAREPIVVAGLPVAARVFQIVEPEAVFVPHAVDGDFVTAGTHLARIEGPAQGLLEAERTALNLLQLLSGIATLTQAYHRQLAGTKAILLDTRKTIPGLREMSKYAARMGGATNHRIGLYDAILIKDNHIAVCGGVGPAVARAAASGHGPVEVECDTLAQVDEALAAGANIILLDNMDTATLTQAVAKIGGRALSEASGGVTLATIRAIAETGVDRISVGRITQSAPAVDIGLDWS